MTICKLALQVDFNQCTRSLQYSFSNTEITEGALAGTFNFNNTTDPKKQDSLEVHLTVTGDSTGTPSVTVSDCTLVSVSNGELGRTYLSPFNEENAVTKVAFKPKLKKTQKGDRVEFTGTAKALPVTARHGQWEISGYLSLNIIIDGNTYNRIFTFDPEGSAGSGVIFP